MICPHCGLPKELCVCEAMTKETQKIQVFAEKRRYRKVTTVIRGIDPSKIDLKKLIKKLKTVLACGGTIKNNEIELQGEHRTTVKSLLIKEGFPENSIEVIS